MSETYDCIVLGVGGFGSGALYHAAKRGFRVLGLEQFEVAHDRGSSHGDTRIIRQAYFEHPDYVPLLRQAYSLWHELEAETGDKLYRQQGLLTVGPADGSAVPGTRLAARTHGLQIDELSQADMLARFPGYALPEGMAAVFEPVAGSLAVERCVGAHVQRAVARGAVLNTEEAVQSWSSDGHRVQARTNRGEYEAGALIVTAGPWAGQMLANLGLRLRVLRKPVFWFPVMQQTLYSADAGAPLFFYEMPAGEFYGFSSFDGQTLKAAEHTGGDQVEDPLHVDRQLRPDDATSVASFLQQCLPGVGVAPVRYSVCMYTKTPDCHFIVDRHPQFANVVFGAGFSGHGFKFTSVLGKTLAELALDGSTQSPVEFLGLNRGGLRASPSSS
ncbi:MAG TPA: N-methyl-L-tryptophan oxidase [Planctomycetaceae bacterium]|nr:N-methyl-L-tryptophan oxidase [Planctomycetaceae bacterium]